MVGSGAEVFQNTVFVASLCAEYEVGVAPGLEFVGHEEGEADGEGERAVDEYVDHVDEGVVISGSGWFREEGFPLWNGEFCAVYGERISNEEFK